MLIFEHADVAVQYVNENHSYLLIPPRHQGYNRLLIFNTSSHQADVRSLQYLTIL